MPAKIARSAPRPSLGPPELLVAIHTSRQSCSKTGKARIFPPGQESSGEYLFNHEALPPLMRLGAFASVAEERGFLKRLPCAQAHNSTAVLLRRQFAVIRPIIHLDGESLILAPRSSRHHVPLPYCAYRCGRFESGLPASSG